MAPGVTYTLKDKRSTRGLDIIQAVYAFVITLGLREVLIGSQTFISDVLFGRPDSFRQLRNISFILFVNVVLIGMRFFWVPRNLRKIIHTASLFEVEVAEPTLAKLPSWFISANWLIIFAHAGLYFIICNEFKHIMFLLSSTGFEATTFTGYFLGHAFLLIINGLWIGMLAAYEQRLFRELPDRLEPREVPGGVIWFRNNLVFSLLALAPLVMMGGTCGPDIHACMARLQVDQEGVTALLPTSPIIVTALYGIVAKIAAAGFQLEHEFIVPFWVLLCFLINSLFDLYKTGRYYVVLEEVEWEAKPPKPDTSAASAQPGGAGG